MSSTYRGDEKRVRVRGVRKDPVDLRRLARALIALAQAQAEVDAQAVGQSTMSTGKITDTITPMVIDASSTDDGDAA
jgi:hypothetical protein